MKKTVQIIFMCFVVTINFIFLYKTFKNPERFSEEAIKGYYQEKTPIDVLFIGASRVYMFWEPMLAYQEYGISSYNLTVSGQTAIGDRYILEEALKTQKPSIVVIEISSLVTDVNEARIHRMTDNMKLSRTKIEYINEATNVLGVTGLNKLEYYLPFIRFHSRWSELSQYDFNVGPSKFRGSYWDQSRFLKTSDTFEYEPIPEECVEKVDERTEKAIEELLSYIKANRINVFFYAAPTNDVDRKKVNYAKKILKHNNMDYIDLNFKIDDIQLNMPEDYCDPGHTNISGAIKVTSYLGDVIKQKYLLEDIRDNNVYADWKQSYTEYYSVITPFLSEEEKDRINLYE